MKPIGKYIIVNNIEERTSVDYKALSEFLITKYNISNQTISRFNKTTQGYTSLKVSEKEIYFQSYKSIIAFCSNDGKITLDEYYWDYSTTTGKYRNQFLQEGIAETRKKIKAGTYTLTNLN